jgi:hypothetical protein
MNQLSPMNRTAFGILSREVSYKLADVSEVFTASIVLVMETAHTSEMSVNS